MSKRASQAARARSRAAAILGRKGGQTVTDKKRAHLASIAKKGAAARWAKKGDQA